jgi:nitroimidazol reductase NimA-like FMN-containing flavoprotein (pyridoxamine 5'-phosphate oxidase superfamily)
VDHRNLDIYGHEPIPWSRPLAELEQLVAGAGQSTWLATAGPGGRPHLTGVGAVWLDGRFYLVSGAGTRKSRNLAQNPDCAVSVSLPGIDLVVEGTAARVTDDATLHRVADRYRAQGWEPTVEDGAFTAPYSAPSAGPPPWDLYEITPTTAYGVATAEPHGATRWRFAV